MSSNSDRTVHLSESLSIMGDEDDSIRNLEGPYSSHLYIGFSPANKKTVFDLRVRLQNHGMICYLRDRNDSIQTSIQEGVGTSQKCLLFLTSDYLKDDWYQIETSAVVEKSERYSRDVVIILKSDDLDVIPERLREFATQQFKPEMLNDEKFLAQFVDVITREPNWKLAVLPKQNIGYGSAFGYFYGFLRLVLPDFRKRLIHETLKNDPELVQKTVKKMLIIMPESCFCATELKSPNQIEFTGKFVVRVAHRAGNQKRDYKSSLYKLSDHERKEEYYFVGELATPLLTMYETYYFGLCGMTMDQLYAERDVFYFTLKAILSHPDNAECNNQFKLLYWSDPIKEKPNQLDIYNFLLPVLRREISLERENERDPSKMGTTDNSNILSPNRMVLKTFESVTVDGSNPARQNPSESGATDTSNLLSPNRMVLKTFEPVQVDGSNPAHIYEELDNYPVNHRPRGKCLIVNIANFEKGHTHLKPRKGAEKDAELLTKLFENLHFEVKVHSDVTAETLESLLLTTHITDHTNYDAFVCCILTHGKLGVIYTSDGKPVEILSIVNFFTDRNCPSLKGKPKMFFIQACQSGDSEPVRNAPTSSQNMASDAAADVESLPLATSETVACVQEGLSNIQDGISNIAVTEVGRTEADAKSAPSLSKHNETLPITFNHKAVLVPGSPDFLMSYSTLPGSISYRDTQAGSLYIQALCDCLRRDIEIDRALKRVSCSVQQQLREIGEYDGEERFQLPFHLTSGMDRLIYL